MYGATGWSQIQRHGTTATTSDANGHTGSDTNSNSSSTAFDSVVAASHMDVPTFCQAIVTPPEHSSDKVCNARYTCMHTVVYCDLYSRCKVNVYACSPNTHLRFVLGRHHHCQHWSMQVVVADSTIAIITVYLLCCAI
jgi:hypothetical protein